MVFTPAERRLLALLALLLATGQLMGLLRAMNRWPERRIPPAALEAAAPPVGLRAPGASPFVNGFLDLNRADSLDLIALPGIGPQLASRILAERRARGGFRSLGDLRDVKGIGKHKIGQLEGLVVAEGDSAAAACNLH